MELSRHLEAHWHIGQKNGEFDLPPGSINIKPVTLCLQFLGLLTANVASKLHVLGSDGDMLCVDCAEVCLIKEPAEIHLRSLLESHNGSGLEAKIGHSNRCQELLLVIHHNFQHNLINL
jgi:hypothetical protein